jgi:hypothetical protein
MSSRIALLYILCKIVITHRDLDTSNNTAARTRLLGDVLQHIKQLTEFSNYEEKLELSKKKPITPTASDKKSGASEQKSAGKAHSEKKKKKNIKKKRIEWKEVRENKRRR